MAHFFRHPAAQTAGAINVNNIKKSFVFTVIMSVGEE